jgi:hypothetical protein
VTTEPYLELEDEPADEEFTTYAHGTELVHAVGLIQMGYRAYTPEADLYREPPVLADDLRQWLAADGEARFADSAFGPPGFVFSTPAAAERFRLAWHVPGLVSQRHYLAWCGRPSPEEEPVDFTTAEQMAAAWAAAMQARKDWIASNA